MTVSFVVQKLFGFMRSHLIVEFSACIKAVLFVTLFLGQEFKVISYFLFCQVQCIWCYVEVFDPLELSFVQDKKYGSVWILLHIPVQFDQHHLLKMCFHCVWSYVWMFILIPLIKVSVFVPIPCGLFYSYSSVAQLKNRDSDSSHTEL